MITFEPVDVGVNLTWQAPFARRHVAPENLPAGLDQPMVPVGVGPRLLALAAQEIGEPTVTERGLHKIVMVAAKRLPTVSVTGEEATVSAGLELYVTWSSNSQVPDFVNAPVETDGFEAGVQLFVKELSRALKPVADGDSTSHWQE